MKKFYRLFLRSFLLLSFSTSLAQSTEGSNIFELNYTSPQNYIIEEIQVVGAQFLDEEAIIAVAGLKIGDVVQIPNETISNAIKKLWKQRLLGDVAIYVSKIIGDRITLTIEIVESPRLTTYFFEGVKKSEEKELAEKINLVKGGIITEVAIKNATQIIKNYFIEKGFFNTTVEITSLPDTVLDNSIQLKINVDKKEKIRINEIFLEGNHSIRSGQLKRRMKDTRERVRFTLPKALIEAMITLQPFKKEGILRRRPTLKEVHAYLHDHVKLNSSSKFINAKYEKDKKNFIHFYNTKGFKDATIVEDSVYRHDEESVNIRLKITEGNQYFIRNISWVGNYKHDDKTLNQVLGIKKGEVYNPDRIEQRLNFNPKGQDVKSLYMDDGYLYFNVVPVEVSIEQDSVDLEMRIHEGPQAYIHNVIIKGNERTHDHVIRREIRTLPGTKFNRAEILRSQRELAQLNLFDPEKTNVMPTPTAIDTAVNLEYTVEEKSSLQQINFAGGWGKALGFIGTFEFKLNNFSLRNATDFKKWRPIPTGDGQELALKIQANGKEYQSYAITFVEPWLGGRRPNSLGVSLNHSLYQSAYRIYENPRESNEKEGFLKTIGASMRLSKRLKWPDDYFIFRSGLSYQYYEYNDFKLLGDNRRFEGVANNFNLGLSIERNSVDRLFYESKGTIVELSTKITPPYSLLSGKDYSKLEEVEQFKWIEYHQWMLDASHFTKIIGKLVLNTRAHFGFLGGFSSKLAVGPFERFYMGGTGLSGQGSTLLGDQFIPLRGYPDNAILPKSRGTNYEGGIIYNKFALELRYPITLNPVAPVYALVFAEGGNNQADYEGYNPFDIKKSVGLGIRFSLPMVGLFGFDWGYGFDRNIPDNEKGEFHFSVGKQFR
ncbi:MAG: BamA/TamA family outer membrane protein [Cytophagales bacterium]|nr:BamA/TamA family outer membrane protein [Cytophagales bacterium]